MILGEIKMHLSLHIDLDLDLDLDFYDSRRD